MCSALNLDLETIMATKMDHLKTLGIYNLLWLMHI
jgi:hypothetical protein